MQNPLNPLSRHFRQPKLYITLPSRGNFYPVGSLEMPPNGEVPVLAMTAKDELRFKTPDALLNGQATVDVIQSCVPSIKNAWDVPSIDVDAILIAIRMATYGEKMEISTTVPVINDERKYDIDLRQLLDTLIATEYTNVLQVGDFKIEIRPLSYKNFTDAALKTFEERRLIKVLDDESLEDSDKIIKFNESFERITNLNISIVTKSVVAVQFQDEPVVTDPRFINEFFENVEKEVFKALIEHTDAQRKKYAIKPFTAYTSPEDQELGAPAEYSVPVVFDQSNFFA